jgi:hypothetical protein
MASRLASNLPHLILNYRITDLISDFKDSHGGEAQDKDVRWEIMMSRCYRML